MGFNEFDTLLDGLLLHSVRFIENLVITALSWSVTDRIWRKLRESLQGTDSSSYLELGGSRRIALLPHTSIPDANVDNNP